MAERALQLALLVLPELQIFFTVNYSRDVQNEDDTGATFLIRFMFKTR